MPTAIPTVETPDPRAVAEMVVRLDARVRELAAELERLRGERERGEWLSRGQFLERYPSMKEGRLKHLLLEREHNGLTSAGAVRQAGTGAPIYIHGPRFWRWWEERNG